MKQEMISFLSTIENEIKDSQNNQDCDMGML